MPPEFLLVGLLSPVYKPTTDELVILLNECETIGQVLAKLGLRNVGSNFNTLVRRLKEEAINYDRFKANARKGSKKGFKKSHEEVMVENSDYNRGGIKRRLIRDNLIPYICKMCGISGEWNGQHLVLVLDHINGKFNDHRLDNLRFLCPNCNSQTPTFSARNKVYRDSNL